MSHPLPPPLFLSPNPPPLSPLLPRPSPALPGMRGRQTPFGSTAVFRRPASWMSCGLSSSSLGGPVAKMSCPSRLHILSTLAMKLDHHLLRAFRGRTRAAYRQRERQRERERDVHHERKRRKRANEREREIYVRNNEQRRERERETARSRRCWRNRRGGMRAILLCTAQRNPVQSSSVGARVDLPVGRGLNHLVSRRGEPRPERLQLLIVLCSRSGELILEVPRLDSGAALALPGDDAEPDKATMVPGEELHAGALLAPNNEAPKTTCRAIHRL